MNILITGASRGIGAATLALLKSRGHNVAGHSTRGGDGLIGGDLAEPEAPRRIWEEALARLGSIDALVNNAGIYEAIAADASDEDWQAAWNRTLTVNLTSAADLCRLAVEHFRGNGDGATPQSSTLRGPRGGRIVNVASRAAFRGDSPQHWHYAASKSAMIGMTKTIARAYAGENILAFAVAPGFTVSEMTEEYLSGRGGAAILADIPLGRVTSTDEVAEAIRWLATEAPAASTGSVIDLNGASYVR
jgi:NAD(P)-dependent dehydrogenase (short-subunit alcohol dehydrogenase family)